MKRSKMVALILKELKKWEACELNKTTAEDILQLVEDAGMKPPFNHDIYYEEYHRVGPDMADGHAWEDEDEKEV